MAEEVGMISPDEIETEILQDWDNVPSLIDLKEDITNADTDNQTHQIDVDRWLDNMAMEGQAKPKTKKGSSQVAPKLIRKQAEWRYSSLADPFTSTEDMFIVSPRSAGDRLRAQQNALVLNHQFCTTIDKVAFIDAYVRDAVDIGTVIVEVSWVSETEEITVEEPTYQFIPSADQELAQQYINLINLRQQSQDAYNQYMNPGLDKAITIFAQSGQLFQAIESGSEMVTKTVETKNHPELEVCESANILIDPSCNGDLSKAQFIGKRYKSSLSELRKDGKYKNLDNILIESATPLADPDYKESRDVGNFAFKDEPRKQFIVYTYWGNYDIHGTGITVPIVCSWVNNTMIRLEENPFPFRTPPFVKAVYMPRRKSIYGEPDGELLEDNQKIVGAVTRGAIDLLAKSANSQTGTKKDFLDIVNRRKFAAGENYEFQSQGRPEEAIYQHKFPEIPGSVFNMLQMQNVEAESLTGVKAFSSGINSQSIGESVGGGRDAMDAASKRETGILNRLAKGVVDIGRMFISMNSEWLSAEEVIRITDEQFVTVRRDDLAGKFDLKLDISTAEENNKRASEISFMLQTKGPDMDFGLYKMLLSDIARLRNMPTMAKRIEEYEPEPDPMAIKEAQLKITLLEAQIAKENMLAYKHQTEAEANGARGFKDGTQGQLNQAKAGTEGSKGRNLDSDSDNKDLTYLKEHDGIAHNEELDKINTKSKNDLDSDLIKSEVANQNGKQETKV